MENTYDYLFFGKSLFQPFESLHYTERKISRPDVFARRGINLLWAYTHSSKLGACAL
jgi:hypothetical protein